MVGQMQLHALARRIALAGFFALFLAGAIAEGRAAALPEADAPKPLDFRDRAFILCWHSFLGKKELDTDFGLDEVGAQLDRLKALGYHFIDLDDALFGRIEGSLNLVATIDDGHRSIAWAYDKVFSERGIKPALLVYPAVIGNSPYFLKAEALQALVEAGCPVGSHGYYHLFVTAKLYRSDKAAFEKEIFGSKARVEALTGLPSYFYAYPYGAFDQITKDEVARAGFLFALAVKPGFVYADRRLDDDYELPRTVVTRAGWETILAFLDRNKDSASVQGPEPEPGRESEEFPAPELWSGEPGTEDLGP
jgi:peptidoglycan/xylan/chitin deacetylase (PgdA/CDA1 family)